MALSITQNPAQINLAQSPTVFTQYESTDALRASSSFQYVAELYYWTGSLTESGSTANYTLQKYPNPNGRGIFDVSRVLASTFTDLRAEDSSSVKHFAIDAYVQYKNNPTGSFITGSHVRSATYQAIEPKLGSRLLLKKLTAQRQEPGIKAFQCKKVVEHSGQQGYQQNL